MILRHKAASFALATALAATLIFGAGPVLASDPPHNDDSNLINCISCHQGHRGQGMALNTQSGNANLCLSCHDTVGTTPFLEPDMADLTKRRGFHHRWDSGRSGYIDKELVTNGSSGEILSTGDYSGTGSKAYAIRIQTIPLDGIDGSGSQTTATFTWSATGGAGGSGTGTCATTPALLNENIFIACQDEPDLVLGTCSEFFCSGDVFTLKIANVATNPTDPRLALRMPDGKVVCSTCHDQHLQTAAGFTSEDVGGDLWKHFMRINNDAAQLCRECHADRFPDTGDPNFPFDHTRSHTATARSHPVDVTLDQNGMGYDRAVPLDANGALQSVGDGIASNDLLLGTGGVVTCLTCHGVHTGAADGNAQTE